MNITKKQLIIVCALILFNLITYNLFVKTGGYDMSGQYIPYDQKRAVWSSVVTLFIGIPLVSFLLGVIVALFPFRKLPYQKRYLRASLLTLLALNGLMAILLGLIMAMTAIGVYPPKHDDHITTNQLSKEEVMYQFKQEAKALFDSSYYYIDIGLIALENGQEPTVVSESIGPKLKLFESRLDSLSREFSATVFALGVTEYELNQLMDALNAYFQPMADKLQQLKMSGVELE